MYNIKIYTVQPFSSMALTPGTGTMTFKKTLSNNKISTGIKFTNEINVGYGTFNFSYNSDELTDVINGDVVKVYKGSSVIYFGKVTNKTITLQGGGIIQNIQCKGYQTILNDFYYQSGGTYAFTKNDDPKNLITDIVGQSDVEVTYFSTDYSNMSLVGSNVNLSFDNDTLQSALQKVLATTTYYYALRPDGKIYFAALPVTNAHRLTFKNDIRSITIEYNSDELVNMANVAYDGGTATDTDTDSKYTYGSKEFRISDTTLKNSATAGTYIDSIFQEKADPKDTIRVDVNNSFDTITLYPGQMITVSNCPIAIEDKIIRRVEYTDQGTSLYLNTKETIEKALSKLTS